MYLLDEFIRLLPVSLKEIRALHESKVLSFLFLALIKGMQKWNESKIFFCNSRGWKLLQVGWCSLVYVEDSANSGCFSFYLGLMLLWVMGVGFQNICTVPGN